MALGLILKTLTGLFSLYIEGKNLEPGDGMHDLFHGLRP